MKFFPDPLIFSNLPALDFKSSMVKLLIFSEIVKFKVALVLLVVRRSLFDLKLSIKGWISSTSSIVISTNKEPVFSFSSFAVIVKLYTLS